VAGSACTTQRFSGAMNSGTTKYQRNICTSSGMLRNSSTHASPSRTIQGRSVVRIVPITDPSTSAMTHAQADTASVHTTPERSRST